MLVKIQKIEEKDNKSSQIIISNQIDKEEVQLTTIPNNIQICDHSDEILDHNEQILSNNIEDLPDLNVLFNSTDGIDLNDVTNENLPITFANLQKLAVVRIRELLKELEIKESINNERIKNLQQEFDEYKITCEKKQNTLIEQVNNADQLQIEAQKPSEEALNQLQLFINEPEKSEQQDALKNITSLPEHANPVEELLNDRLSSQSEDVNEDTESIENLPQSSLIEEKQNEMNQIEQQVEIPSTFTEEKIALQSSENRIGK
ncbi:unnamed protein product [Rotaria sp. Silwood2]|nr:unnamed protein product [Rotaria sp. Silwood2]